MFITIEGPDGAGKSTQVGFIKEFFQERGLNAYFTREPGGTRISEKLRDIVLDPSTPEMSERAEALLYAASRAQLVHEVIAPKVRAGEIVVCDRYIDSSMAYQAYGRGLGDDILKINEFGTDNMMPDLTILLILDPEKGRGRLDKNSLDRLESEKLEFHRRVYEGYRKIAEDYPERVKTIDADDDIETIRKEIESILLSAIEKTVNDGTGDAGDAARGD